MLKLILFLLPIFLYSQQLSTAMQTQLLTKGKKIANILCQKDKLKQIKLSNNQKDITTLISMACTELDEREISALKYYLKNQNRTDIAQKLPPPPKHTKCPACGMIVSLYPKWIAVMGLNDKKLYFDGVKDMMRYYLQKADFKYERKNITHMQVQDFYTLTLVDAKKAFYVIGADIRGPMGNDFIPFRTKEKATIFLQDHHAKSVVTFKDISPKLIKELQRLH